MGGVGLLLLLLAICVCCIFWVGRKRKKGSTKQPLIRSTNQNNPLYTVGNDGTAGNVMGEEDNAPELPSTHSSSRGSQSMVTEDGRPTKAVPAPPSPAMANTNGFRLPKPKTKDTARII